MIGLEFRSEQNIVMWRPLERGSCSVGRNPECDICIPDEQLAPIQFLLNWEGEALVLLNRAPEGTLVGAEWVRENFRLANGDAIKVGPLKAVVRYGAVHGQHERQTPKTRTLLADKPMAASLRVRVWSAGRERLWDVSSAGLSFGTEASNDVVLEDPYVSAFHARLGREGGRWLLRDLGSRNGVFLEGRKIESAEVGPDLHIKLGQTRITLESTESHERGASRAPKHGPGLAARANHQSAALSANETSEHPFVGKSPSACRVRTLTARLADNCAPVLVTGETGTGKEVVARLLSTQSRRADKPYVPLNCGALGRSLIESELFGHEKGAFTGATERKKGAFEVADGGTLFLDEVGELPLDLQPQLLRVLETGEVRRVGAVESFTVDVRLIAATNRQLEHEVAEGRFRADLFHRLHVLALELPPLRQRREDIGLLANHFLRQFAPAGEIITLGEDAARKLAGHSWPGNVRELRNVLQRAVLLRHGNVLLETDITFTPSTLGTRVETAQAIQPRTLAELERQAIVLELARHGGNKKEAAVALGVARSTIHRKIEEYGIDASRYERA